MKKKILIISDSFRTGGIQSSLKTFLKYLSGDFDIEVFLFNRDGFESAGLNKNIKVIFGSKLLQAVSCTSDYAKKQGLSTYILRKIFAFFCLIFSSHVMYKIIFLFEKKIKNIDTVISYSNNVSDRSVYFGYNLFALQKVEAKQKIAYVHADYSTIHSKYCDKEYEKFDKIWFVSEYTKKEFFNYYQGPKKEYDIIYNFCDFSYKGFQNPYKNKKFHIITVGRLEENKSQIDSIEIAKQLKKRGLDFEWYLVGDGPDKNKITKLITENGLDKNLIVTGYRNDAKNYIKYADVLVSLSKKETFGLTVLEALSLGTIAIYKDLSSIREAVGENGIALNTNNAVAEKISALQTDKNLYAAEKAKSFIDFDNASIIEKIERVLEK